MDWGLSVRITKGFLKIGPIQLGKIIKKDGVQDMTKILKVGAMPMKVRD